MKSGPTTALISTFTMKGKLLSDRVGFNVKWKSTAAAV